VERLVESLGLTRLTTVPSAAARAGQLWPINPVVRPYLELFPVPNGPELDGGLARFTFPVDQTTDETSAQLRVDHNFSGADLLFIRYTIDDAARGLPSSYPQFSSDQKSRSQWLTIEEKRTLSPALLNTARFSYSRVHLGQTVVSKGVAPELAFVQGQATIGELAVGPVDVLGPHPK